MDLKNDPFSSSDIYEVTLSTRYGGEAGHIQRSRTYIHS